MKTPQKKRKTNNNTDVKSDFTSSPTSDFGASTNDNSQPQMLPPLTPATATTTSANNNHDDDNNNSNREGDNPKPRKAQRAARASRACRTCRRQKTRCFPSNTKSCLRCQTLALDCSFLENSPDNSNDTMLMVPGAAALTNGSAPNSNNANNNTTIEGANNDSDSRMESLERNVSEVLQILKGDPQQYNVARDCPTYSTMSYKKRVNDPLQNTTISKHHATRETPSFGLPSVTFVTSPYNSFGSLVSQRNQLPPIARLYNPQMVVHDQDIISLGLITEAQAEDLLSHFRDNYNRWVSFPEDIPIPSLLDRIRRRCSLLLTVCCCVSVRFFDRELRGKVYKLLLRKMQTELHQSFLVVPQTIEFMQALAIISIYASSLSEGDNVIDGWFYSSLALQHFITKDILGLVMSFDGIGPVTEFDEITAYRVWNHLCLVHLVQCVMTGRMCILDEVRLDLCRRTLDLNSSTNFDSRMIAEITLHLIIYNCIEGIQSLASVEDDLKSWLDEWGWLFDQPIIQFTESAYHYGYFLILLHWNYIKHATETAGAVGATSSAAVSIGLISSSTNAAQLEQTFAACDEMTINKMARHLTKVVEGLLAVEDNFYFAYLSDQVHFCGVYSAVMLCHLIRTMAAYGRMMVFKDRTLKQSVLNKTNELEAKFRSITASEEDLASKYADTLLESVSFI